MHPWLFQCRDGFVYMLGVFGGFIQSIQLHDLPALFLGLLQFFYGIRILFWVRCRFIRWHRWPQQVLAV